MAPSPTGEYHVGHIRTVLYNFALAKKYNGSFLIRIEDTDRARLVDGAVDRILDIINDYGLSWDEGPRVGGEFGPYIQSERLPLYKKYAEELIEKNAAYYCFCSKQRLEELRDSQQKQGLPTTKYDKHCLNLPKEEISEKLKNGEDYVIRLNVPNDKNIFFHDEVFGDISINSNDIDDQVLLKSDGFPSYHLAVVIDDHLMKITHVMRGNDWIPSTPKHVLLYQAFGWEMSKIIHLPNLKELGGDKKLSKRFGSVFAIEFLKEGYLPEAVLNFLMFLGWNPGTEKEIYSLDEFVKDFSVDRIQTTDLVAFDRQKLLWMNGTYIRNLPTDKLWERIQQWNEKFKTDSIEHAKEKPTKYTLQALELVKERMKLLSEFNDLTRYFYEEPTIDSNLYLDFVTDTAKAKEVVSHFVGLLENIENSKWTRDYLDKQCHELLSTYGYKPKEAFMTLRIAVTGEKATPQIFDVLEVLGKDMVISRLKKEL